MALLCGSATGTGLLHAQSDIGRPSPNVLLLVDSSGSMEYKASTTDFPVCDPSTSGASEKSRWVDLVEVLTGSIDDYRCEALDRNAADFRTTYTYVNAIPYDYGYEYPYHRPMSGSCRVLPNSAALDPNDAFAFPTDAIIYRTGTGSSCEFNQARDGLLDSFQSLARFGLMTFDTLTDPGTGFNGTAADPVGGMSGAWSYFWGERRQGRPADCVTLVDYEVGARNAAAPPWEGKMVAFGPPHAGQEDRTLRNEQIQKILQATRPYLATPIAGLLDDARQFLWEDESEDPLLSGERFGPSADPYVRGGCRDTHIILLTDGEPNLDLRPHCDYDDTIVGLPNNERGEKCPYAKPEEIAHKLATGSPAWKRVKTHVIGFALSEWGEGEEAIECADLSDDDLTGPEGVCANTTDKRLTACCTLNRIAYNGGTERARFADDVDELRRELMGVLMGVIDGTSRTRAVFAASGPPDTNAAAYRFFSAFTPHPDGWRAKLERQRWVCRAELDSPIEAHEEDVDPSEGDDFIANVNSASGLPRTFITVVGRDSASAVNSTGTIRPNLDDDDPDGAGLLSGTPVVASAAQLGTEVAPAALGVLPTAECLDRGHATAATCSKYYLDWWVGLDNGSEQHRCPSQGTDCARVGAIYHSTPVAVNRPSELLRDETYDIYASTAAIGTRPLMLYTSTTDGFLHAFKVNSNDPEHDTVKVDSLGNNELWAFAPPAVLPGVPTLFSSPVNRLLDSAPVVREVVATARAGSDYGYRLERTIANARSLQNTWRTILVQGFGESSGYFALDVTDPLSGPTFLWQLTTDGSGNALFGKRTGTPLITTLYFAEDSLSPAKEVAVAILPGGAATLPGSPVPRKTTDLELGIQPSSLRLRPRVPEYTDPSDIRARSVTIVRLDDGRVIRRFQRVAETAAELATEPPLALDTEIVQTAPLDSPISGQPAAFPGGTGMVADRIFVGDADGTLWRIDVSSRDPDSWRMQPYFDLHATDTLYDTGQPIVSPPVLSTREDGMVTILVASGDQETFTPSGISHVYSLTDALKEDYWSTVGSTETISDDYTPFAAKVNWYHTFTQGERVAGPLAVFSRVAYFASYTPAPLTGDGVCSNGSSKVWGMDYVLPAVSATTSEETASAEEEAAATLTSLSGGGKPQMLEDPTAPAGTDNPWRQYLDNTTTDALDDSAIFGVTVAMVPTCSGATDPGDGTTGGGHRTITSEAPAKFQLLLQTGKVSTADSGGSIGFATVDISSPDTASIIDSWAAVLE